MSSISSNARYLQQAKAENRLQEIQDSKFAPNFNTPTAPSYPPESNPRLRTSLPANLVLQPDSLRQFYNVSMPQYRMNPLPASSNAQLGAAIQSNGLPSTPAPLVK